MMKILDIPNAVAELTVGASHESITQGIHQSRRRKIMTRIATIEEMEHNANDKDAFNHILLIEVLEAERKQTCIQVVGKIALSRQCACCHQVTGDWSRLANSTKRLDQRNNVVLEVHVDVVQNKLMHPCKVLMVNIFGMMAVKLTRVHNLTQCKHVCHRLITLPWQ